MNFSFQLASIAALPPPPSEADCELASPSAPNPFPGECGRFNASRSPTKQQRIIGGKDAPRGMIPWQAWFPGGGPNGGCGATIIDDRHIITSAWCASDGRQLMGKKVRAGHIFQDSNDSKQNATKFITRCYLYCG